MADLGGRRGYEGNNRGKHGVPAGRTFLDSLKSTGLALWYTIWIIFSIGVFVYRHPRPVAAVLLSAGMYINSFVPPKAHPGLSWGTFEDQGCIQQGQRRMYAKLIGLGIKHDWNVACTTMPARINGKWYNTPAYCEKLRKDGTIVWVTRLNEFSLSSLWRDRGCIGFRMFLTLGILTLLKLYPPRSLTIVSNPIGVAYLDEAAIHIQGRQKANICKCASKAVQLWRDTYSVACKLESDRFATVFGRITCSGSPSVDLRTTAFSSPQNYPSGLNYQSDLN
ncbi:hypothetical protein BDV93DRAFT_573747 [Ceratobasidium sp. AG-I]|nr:hypothetical protein BDV93DRAFT_573747 [Ceratobasidium sp. AG-I]